MNEQNNRSEWTERTYGVLPEGSKVKKETVDTKNYIEQGERTWTTGQTVRDILQNHLDANTQQHFDRIVSSVIDTSNLSSNQNQQEFDEFSYTLFRYRKSLADYSPQAEEEIELMLNQHAQRLPIKSKHLHEDGTINLSSIKESISATKETPPRVRYRVTDRSSEDSKEVWVEYQEMKSPKYQEKLSTDLFRYQITSVQFQDEGSGFDSKLSAFYKSTKVGKRHLRGRFGEGAKMSETHLVRNGATAKMRSSYQINGGINRDRVWQQRPYVGADQVVKLRSIQADLPPDPKRQFGSFTRIEIGDAEPQFQDDFLENIDPRISESGLAINCLDYSEIRYHYPISRVDEHTKPVGVSLEGNPSYQYVQGLRVGEDNQADKYGRPLFSYDFLDSSILRGRDRSELKDSMEGAIRQFWHHAESPELLARLIQRSLLEPIASGISPEFMALRDLIFLELGDLNTQRKRTWDTVMQIMPSVIGIELGRKNVVVSNYDSSKPENRTLIRTLITKGYHIVNIARTAVSGNFERLNRYHRGEFEVYTLDTLRKDIDALVGQLDAESESVQFVDGIYKSAYSEIQELVQSSGMNASLESLSELPTYLETVDVKTELPVELVFDEETEKFVIKIRPDSIYESMQDGKGQDYWKNRIQVELLAALGRNNKFLDRNSVLMSSQKNAQKLLDKTLHTEMTDVQALPTRFNHEPLPLDEQSSLNSFIEKLGNMENSLAGMGAYDQAREFEITLDRAEAIIGQLDELPKNYREEIQRILTRRLIVEDGEVGLFFKRGGSEDPELVFIRQTIEDLPIVATIDGRSVYKMENRLFVIQNIPEGSVVKMNKHHTYVVHNGEILNFEDHRFGKYDFASYPFNMDSGCLFMRIPSYEKDLSEEFASFEKGLKELTINSPEKDKSNTMKIAEGIVETPLPVEYGVDEWDNPVRVFEDIVQNHIDATPDGKATLSYEVVREGNRKWVTEDTLTDSDQIVGLTIMDNGGGYSPDDLGTMGKSSKKSPMFAGKYGEGQKMVSAAAARNGLSLSFTSLSKYNGEDRRWSAQVDTREEELIIGGENQTAQRVIFNLNSKQTDGEQSFTSATTLRLPNEDESENIEWQKWLEVFDPRKKDERGLGGLSRYVINLREGDDSNIIDLGYMRILLDDPGAIYENGLLIARDTNKSVVGYDVPELVTTRERNSYDSSKLRSYIAHAMEDCRDPRYPQTIMKQFKERHLDQMIDNSERPLISEADLDFGNVFLFANGFLSGEPLWNYAYAKELGSYLVYSEEALRSEIKYGEESLKQLYTSASDRERIQKEMEQAWTTLTNVKHISKDRLILLRKDSYSAWAKIFPTAEEYVMGLAEQRIEVSPEVTDQLTKVVAASGETIQEMVTKMRADEESLTTYKSIVAGDTPDKVRPYTADKAMEKAEEKLDFWSDQARLQEQNAVFVSPSNSGYLGLASKDSIGLNERLLVAEELSKVAGTSRHELLHKVFGLRDYTPEFVMLLLELAKFNKDKVLSG